MYTIKFNNSIASEHRLEVIERPSIPTAERDVKTYNINGKDGALTIDKGTVQDVNIDVSFNFMSKEHTWMNTLREAKQWLYKKIDNKLFLSDDEEYYYLVKNVVVSSTDREAKTIGKFDVTFLCSGYQYLAYGDIEIEQGKIYNPHNVSHPTYKILGEGVCVLTVNGKTMTANIGQNLTIDTERMISYRMDGTVVNTSVTGDYTELYLQEGDNEISITDGFSLSVIPHWRCRL